jgi:large subunit ribosomal protein L23
VRILIEKPFITEKSMKLAHTGLYTFLVHKEATKLEIAKIISSKFSVDVISVKTINVHPLKKLQRSRKGYFTKPGFKKAIVQLKSGQKLAVFETASAPDPEAEVTTADTVPVVKEKKSLLKGTKVKIEKESSGQSQESSKNKKTKKEERS